MHPGQLIDDMVLPSYKLQNSSKAADVAAPSNVREFHLLLFQSDNQSKMAKKTKRSKSASERMEKCVSCNPD